MKYYDYHSTNVLKKTVDDFCIGTSKIIKSLKYNKLVVKNFYRTDKKTTQLL